MGKKSKKQQKSAAKPKAKTASSADPDNADLPISGSSAKKPKCK